MESRAVTKQAAAGAAKAMPIVLGYVPVAFAFGVLARQAGLSELNTVLMSLLVYAGASQFVAVGLFGAGASPATIVLTTFIVNLRHIILSSALAPYMSKWKAGRLAAFGFQVTDETFALHAAGFASETCPRRRPLPPT